MEHTSKQFEQELGDLNRQVLAMGDEIQLQLARALDVIARSDTALVEQVVTHDQQVNRMQMEIDRNGMEIIAKRQPTAVDLRQILCSMQAANDLERVGDEIKKIAQRAAQFQTNERFRSLRLNEVRQLGALVKTMLQETLTAFEWLDVIAARDLIGRDRVVDEEFERVMRLIATYMMEDPRAISAGLDIAFLAKSLERIADHAKNISEETIFIAEGYDPRHQLKV
jgi:phosphate transport system protein